MKNVRYIFVLLLLINCTADPIEETETLDALSTQNVTQTCVGDLPEVRLTNNGTQNFDFIVYAHDYSVLHTQNVSMTTVSGWIEMPNEGNVIVVVTNDISYGQKVEINLELCDDIELEVDATNTLIVTGG